MMELRIFQVKIKPGQNYLLYLFLYVFNYSMEWTDLFWWLGCLVAQMLSPTTSFPGTLFKNLNKESHFCTLISFYPASLYDQYNHYKIRVFTFLN